MKNILVLCTGNSCRSQIAHGFLKHFAKDKARIYSAGIEAHGLNQRAVATMEEIGIDISNHESNSVDEYMLVNFQIIITVCDHAQENCPFISSSALRIHKSFRDPSKVQGSEVEINEAFTKVREEIKIFTYEVLRKYIS